MLHYCNDVILEIKMIEYEECLTREEYEQIKKNLKVSEHLRCL